MNTSSTRKTPDFAATTAKSSYPPRLWFVSWLALVFGFVLALGAHPLAARAAGTLAPGETLILTSLNNPVAPDDTSESCFAFSAGTCGTDPTGSRFGARTSALTSFSRGQASVSHAYEFEFDDGGLYDTVIPVRVSGRAILNGFLALVGGGETHAKLALEIRDLGSADNPSTTGGVVIHEAVLASHGLQGVTVTGLNFGLKIEGGAPYIGAGAGPELKFNVELKKKVIRDTLDFGTQVLLRRGNLYRLDLQLGAVAKKGATNGLALAQLRLGGPVTDMLDLDNWLDGVMQTIRPDMPVLKFQTANLLQDGLFTNKETLRNGSDFGDTADHLNSVGPSADLPTTFLELVLQRFRNRIPPVVEEGLPLAGVEIEELSVTAADDQVELVGLWEIERNLSRCNPFVSLFQPQRNGGQMEVAFALVRRLIAQSDAIGGLTSRASLAVAEAEASRAGARYSRAYNELCKAYREVAKGSL